MKYDFSMKPIEVKTKEQVEILAKVLSNPPKIIRLDKAPEEQKSFGKIVNVIKGVSNKENIMNKEEKLKHKEYLKDVKQARKKLVKMAKNFSPFDFEYTLDLFIQGIHSMREYYARGYYVRAKDIEGMPTRLDMCDEILAAYVEYLDSSTWEKEAEAWNNFCDTVKKYLLYLWD